MADDNRARFVEIGRAHSTTMARSGAPQGRAAMGVDQKGNPMAAINLRCLEGVDLEKIEISPFDGRSR